MLFEHAVERGSADASYGVEVAATAGIDERVVDRARTLLARPENDPDHTEAPDDGRGSTPEDTGPRRDATESADTEDIAELLGAVDIATMTPLEAMNTLAKLKRRVDSDG